MSCHLLILKPKILDNTYGDPSSLCYNFYGSTTSDAPWTFKTRTWCKTRLAFRGYDHSVSFVNATFKQFIYPLTYITIQQVK